MESRRTSGGAARAAVVAVVGCTVLVLLLAVWAASIGPGEVLRGEGPDRVTLPSAPQTTPSVDGMLGPLSEGTRPGPDEQSPLLAVLAGVLMLGAGVALAVVLGLGARHLWRLRPAAAAPSDHVEFDVLEPPSRAVIGEALARDAEERRRALAQGSPRNAIVACWQRFEDRAADLGVHPRASETSTEFARRVLELSGADAATVSALAEGFREARFSRHEIGEDARARAIALWEDLDSVLVGRGERS
ncbi:hypothetical protein I601_1325 [Nocardioides dokdonensis FR1436]|uniref:Protein-glutamine gamma-glutamyltransferase-like C-terminal domain-containing protein n=1 Tax=Nocardioides dokdonensis FR1436 TaxID=1300347 RepID=A0A1A9GHP1_9ACTN|nr:DUF4129 domain-containing protein [Nocardioides dokdonensis]ANH37764.1 hypothetical protein I601_1325 [Nocardioides dokdonensis FR1436]